MNNLFIFRGEGRASTTYLKPEIEITNFATESGFQASLPSIGTEEGDPWEEMD